MKGNVNTTTTVDRPTLPLSLLRLSPSNVRKSRPGRLESLASTIKSVGVIENLVLIRDTENPDGFEVIVGGRRLQALQLLLSKGEIGADYPVPYDLRDASEATAVSLIENTEREAMHPADEFDAFAKLTKEGRTIDQIADAFGVTPLVVERRLMLAKAAPGLVSLFRDDAITTDQLIALCSTDDHALQVSAWEQSPRYHRSPDNLRRLVTSEEVDASRDSRITFIGGLAVFEAAGGVVRRDLFSAEGGGGFIRDVVLLEKLVADKLEAEAAQVRAEGWRWVEVVASFDYQTFNRFGRLGMMDGPLSDDDAAALAALRTEADTLSRELQALENDGTDEYSEAQSERIDEIYERHEAIGTHIDGIESAAKVYAESGKRHAGVWVGQENGRLRIERGLVKTEDRKAAAKEAGSEVEGGRETQAAGRKDGAYSDALRRSLLGRRNHAVQMATARNPRVAKVLLAVQMVNMVRSERFYGSGNEGAPCDLSLHGGYAGARTMHPVVGSDAAELGEQLETELESLAGKLPKKQSELWDVLAGKTDADLDAVIAYGVGASVSVADTHRGLTAKLLDALSFDVSHHICMTADNYFNRVPKPLTLDALKEAGLDHERPALEKLKRGELATEAERRIRAIGSGWVPKLILTPAPKVAKAAPTKADSAKAKKAAAGKTTNAKVAAKVAPKAKPAKSQG